MESHDTIVFQFPFYWFSSPPLLKQWLDEVILHGWAYGSNSGYKLAGKRMTLVVTAGIDEDEYTASGKYKYTMKELFRPYELTFDYVKAEYKEPFVYYGIERDSSDEWIEKVSLCILIFWMLYRLIALVKVNWPFITAKILFNVHHDSGNIFISSFKKMFHFIPVHVIRVLKVGV